MASLASTPRRVNPLNPDKDGAPLDVSEYSTVIQTILKEHLKDDNKTRIDSSAKDEWMSILEGFSEHTLQTFPKPDAALWAAIQAKVKLCGFIMELFERAARRVDTLFEDSDERSVALCSQVVQFYLTVSSWTPKNALKSKLFPPSELRMKAISALGAIAAAFAFNSGRSKLRSKILDGALSKADEVLNAYSVTGWSASLSSAELLDVDMVHKDTGTLQVVKADGPIMCCMLVSELLFLSTICLDIAWPSSISFSASHKRAVHSMKRFTGFLLNPKSCDLGAHRVNCLEYILKSLLKSDIFTETGRGILTAIPSMLLLFRLKEGPDDSWRTVDEYILDLFRTGEYTLQPVHRCRTVLELVLKNEEVKEGAISLNCCLAAVRSTLKHLDQNGLKSLVELTKAKEIPSIQLLHSEIEQKLNKSESTEKLLGKRRWEEDPWREQIIRLLKPAVFDSDNDWASGSGSDDASFAASILNSLRRKFSDSDAGWTPQRKCEALQSLKELAGIIPFPENNETRTSATPISLPLLPTYTLVITQLMLCAEGSCPSSLVKSSQEALAASIKHQVQFPSKGKLSAVLNTIQSGLRDKNRSTRLAAGRALHELVSFYVRIGRPAEEYTNAIFELLSDYFENESDAVVEALLITIGNFGRIQNEEVWGNTLMTLVTQLEKRNVLLRGLTYMQLQNLAKHSGKTPYLLVAPHMRRLAKYVVSVLPAHINTLLETCRFLSLSPNDFLSLTLPHTIPELFATCNLPGIEAIGNQLDKSAPGLFFETSADVLTHIFLLEGDEETSTALAFTVNVLSSRTRKISLSSVIKSWIIPVLGKLVIALGEPERQKARNAIHAIQKLALAIAEPSDRSMARSKPDVGNFLRGYMLGIVANLSDMLQDVQSRKSDESKLRVLRGLRAFVTSVGSSVNSVAPQIMATLQATVTSPALSITALQTWYTFLKELSTKDLGPHVGPTTAALANIWPSLSDDGREFAKMCIEYLLNDAFSELGDYVDDIVDFSKIPDLSESCERIQSMRERRSLKDRFGRILERLSSDNDTVVLQALKELRKCMLSTHADYIEALASGDVFDPAVGLIMRSLLAVACRDGNSIEELHLLAFECIGILGAADPDRFDMTFQDDSMVVLNNFSDEDESVRFALHLVQSTLVGAFRSTSDIKYQTHLAFAIQELMKFCKFTPELVRPEKSIPLKVRTRWKSLPKLVLETITPLLEARFSVNNSTDIGELDHPIFSHEATYREWIQQWTAFLITRVQGDIAKTLFNAFRMTIRNKDVSVARQLLPHLVLNILISGEAEDAQKIREEIVAVLEAQLGRDKTVSADKRLLGAQVIFMLMDHLNKWIRVMRQDISNKRSESRRARQNSVLNENEVYVIRVDSILASIDQVMIAEAAFQCKAYARSLMNFEKQIVLLRERKASRDTFQNYYNRLHEIYSHLDEPDGMEGVSAFISVNSIEHQIRQHESTGKWTSAQSCWELRLQQSPDSLDHHLGLLRCLRNLGHYDSLKTHIQGILTRNPDWENALVGFRIEGAWMSGDWDGVKQLIDKCGEDGSTWETAIARLLLSLRSTEPSDFSHAMSSTLMQLGTPISAAGERGYRRAYDAVLKLHLVRDIENIRQTFLDLEKDGANTDVLSKLFSVLSNRVESTLPTFRTREPILSIHRTAFSQSLASKKTFSKAIGRAWLESAKIARKAGHWQTAYSAVLQAQECRAPYTFYQSAKLVKASGEPLRALYDLDNALLTEKEHQKLVMSQGNTNTDEDFFVTSGGLKHMEAKANLLRARWMRESERYEVAMVAKEFQELTKRFSDYESAFFHAGHYQDECFRNLGASEKKSRGTRMNLYTVRMYSQAIRLGSKYAYQTIPRLLTIWLDMGEDKTHQNSDSFNSINNEIAAAIKYTPVYKWLTAFPQIVSRVDYDNRSVYQTLSQLISTVIREYPQQALWLFISVVKSTKSKREKRGKALLEQLANNSVNAPSGLPDLIARTVSMVTELLRLCDHPIKDDSIRVLSMTKDFPILARLAPSSLIIPLQESMTVALPPNSSSHSTHQPFTPDAPTIQAFHDEIDVMKSLAKPRKITIEGSNGKKYMFLGKPKDDLRKDARLMDFNSIINKLLKSNSESRRRQLHIRTYSVVTLNEECGFIQWVPNTAPIRPILLKYYSAKGIEPWNRDMAMNFMKIKESTDKEAAKIFQDKIISACPPVFHEWFLDTFPEPTAWLSSRLAYGRTAAVMSMVGFILGLGDRHLENILMDVSSGDAIHVDFNCLFEKGKSLEIPERVPFRLTHNMVDALGVTGVEGVFRKAAELTMQLLRDNKDVLMSVLDAFIHDPLVEWEDEKRRMERQARKNGDVNAVKVSTDLRKLAKNALIPIERKLKGYFTRDLDRNDRRDKEITTSNLVQMLIEEATDLRNLSKMYPGWAPQH